MAEKPVLLNSGRRRKPVNKSSLTRQGQNITHVDPTLKSEVAGILRGSLKTRAMSLLSLIDRPKRNLFESYFGKGIQDGYDVIDEGATNAKIREKVKLISQFGNEKLPMFAPLEGIEAALRLQIGLEQRRRATGRKPTVIEKFTKGATAFGADVVGDPFTYVSLGAAGAGRKAVREAIVGVIDGPLTKELGEKAAKEVGEQLLRPSLRGKAPTVSTINRRISKLPRNTRKVFSKNTPGIARGGVGIEVPFSRARKVIVPGTVTSRVTAPIGQALRSAPVLAEATEGLQFGAKAAGAGLKGFRANRRFAERRAELHLIDAESRRLLETVAKEFKFSGGKKGGRIIEKALVDPEYARTLVPRQQEGIVAIRKILDDALDAANQARKAAGEKEIGHWKNYFPRPSGAGGIARTIGSDPTTIVTNLPNSTKFAQTRKLRQPELSTARLTELNDFMESTTGVKGYFRDTDSAWQVLHGYLKGVHTDIANRKIANALESTGTVFNPKNNKKVSSIFSKEEQEIFEMLGLKSIIRAGKEQSVLANEARNLPKGYVKVSDDVAIPQLKGTYVPKQIADEINANLTKSKIPTFFRITDTITRSFKKHVTIPFTGFLMRNIRGGVFSNLIGGANVADHELGGLLVLKMAVEARKLDPMRAVGAGTDFSQLKGGVFDKSFKRLGINPQTGKHWTGREVVEWTENINLTSQFSTFRLHQPLGVVGGPKTKVGSLVARGPGRYLDLAEGTMRQSENFMRMSAFLAGLRKFKGDPWAAREFSLVRHGNYDELTKAEEWIRRVIPFYKWMRTNIPYQITSLAERPAKHSNINRFFENFLQDKGELKEFEESGFRDPYSDERRGLLLGGPLGEPIRKLAAGGKDTPVFASMDTPFEDLNQLNPREMFGQTLLGRFGESISGQSFFGPPRELKDRVLPRHFAMLAPLEKVPGMEKYFGRNAHGDLMVDERLLRFVTSGPNPLSRYHALLGRLMPTHPLNDSERPVGIDDPALTRFSSDIFGLRLSPQDEERQQLGAFRAKKEMDALEEQLARYGYYDRYNQIRRLRGE